MDGVGGVQQCLCSLGVSCQQACAAYMDMGGGGGRVRSLR